MAISQNISDLTQVGRTSAPDPSLPQVSVSKSLDFTAVGDYTLDFTTVNQTQQFGIPRTLYFDNGTNPNQVIVTVSITGQQLTLAPYSIGYYNLTASQASTIQFVSAGGASAVSPLSVFNHIVQPSVWYSYGTSNPVSSSAVEGSIVDGSSIAAATNPNPFLSAIKDYATGLLHIMSGDATGKPNVNVINQPANQGAYTDRSNNNLSGASEALMAANPARRVLVINNPNVANPIAVNLTGGAAVLNTAGSLTIAAGQTITIDKFPTNGAITVIGTAGDDVTAYEG